MNSGFCTLQIYPRVYVNMFRVKPRATVGLIFFTVLIQNSDRQWKVLSGCLDKVALGNSLGSSDFPSGLRLSGKSDDPREFPRATFSRQPLRTFHCLYHFYACSTLLQALLWLMNFLSSLKKNKNYIKHGNKQRQGIFGKYINLKRMFEEKICSAKRSLQQIVEGLGKK